MTAHCDLALCILHTEYVEIKQRDSLHIEDSTTLPEDLNEYTPSERRLFHDQHSQEKEDVYLEDYQNYRQKWNALNFQFRSTFEEINLKDNEYVGLMKTWVESALR